ncbi:Uncharacterised protein [Sphingobacterium daejeonense]|jgi:hypothetical protein|nr:Uncharacterised protein [Sphingobacterium daejeonense]
MPEYRGKFHPENVVIQGNVFQRSDITSNQHQYSGYDVGQV